jgi:hypothetical protein
MISWPLCFAPGEANWWEHIAEQNCSSNGWKEKKRKKRGLEFPLSA